MKIEAKGWTDIGLKRETNEDFFDISFKGKDCLCLLADGIGGGPRGEMASQLAVRGIKKFIDISPEEGDFALQLEDFILRKMEAAVLKVNKMLYRQASENQTLAGMGTTIVGVYCSDKKIYLTHVGDSRCYLIRSGEISRLTKDHSYVQELHEEGIITEDQIESHPKKNIITRALGAEPEVKPDSKSLPIQNKDIFLLCSDGLTNYVKDSEIKEIVETYRDDFDTAAEVLIDLANKRGGGDNTTLILLQVTKERRFAFIASLLTEKIVLFTLLAIAVGLIGGGLVRLAFGPNFRGSTGSVSEGVDLTEGPAQPALETKQQQVVAKETECPAQPPPETKQQQVVAKEAESPAQPPPETKQQQVVAKEAEGPAQPSPETKKQQVIETKGEFVVQAGAFRSKKDARKRAAFLGNKYLEGKENFIYLAGPVTVRGESYYRVLLGPFHETRANTFLQQIEIEDRAGAFVRKITPSDR